MEKVAGWSLMLFGELETLAAERQALLTTKEAITLDLQRTQKKIELVRELLELHDCQVPQIGEDVT